MKTTLLAFKKMMIIFLYLFWKSLRLHLQKFQLIYITLDDLYSNFCFNQITTFATSRSMTGTRVIKMWIVLQVYFRFLDKQSLSTFLACCVHRWFLRSHTLLTVMYNITSLRKTHCLCCSVLVGFRKGFVSVFTRAIMFISQSNSNN